MTARQPTASEPMGQRFAVSSTAAADADLSGLQAPYSPAARPFGEVGSLHQRGDSARPQPARYGAAGLSLLEVILAVAILGGCMAVIGELVRLGVRHAEEARELTRAQLLCESKLEEIAAGVTAAESAAAVAFETDPEWTYTVETSARWISSSSRGPRDGPAVGVGPLVSDHVHAVPLDPGSRLGIRRDLDRNDNGGQAAVAVEQTNGTGLVGHLRAWDRIGDPSTFRPRRPG